MAVFRIVSPHTGRASWIAVVNYVDADGKRRQTRRSARTLPEAKRVEVKLIQARDIGQHSDRLALGTYLSQWLSQQTDLRPHSVNCYRTAIALATDHIGHVPIDKLTPVNVLDLRAALRANGASPNRIQYVSIICKAALRDALRFDLVARNIFDLVDPIRVDRFEPAVISHEDLRRVFELAPEYGRVGVLLRLLALTGLRLGEAIGLRWADVGTSTLMVRQSIDSRGNVTRPKTAKSQRRIALSPGTLALLAPLRDRSEYVFAGISQQMVRHVWHRLRDRAGIDRRARVHDLRHAHGSHLIAAGFPLPVVSERLGHSQQTTTLLYYSHALPGADVELAAKLDGIIGNPRGRNPNGSH